MFPTAYLFKPISEETRTEKRRRLRCVSWGCRRKADENHARCQTCRSRLYRLRHPVRYAYYAVRESARKRKIPFHLTYQEFSDFAARTGYVEHKGQRPESLTIDRIFSDRPYTKDNIRILTHQDNSSHHYEQRSGDPF